MQSTRRGRLEAVLQKELSENLRDLKDPRIPHLTVTGVEVTQDGSSATISVSILGEGLTAAPDADKDAAQEAAKKEKMRLCLKGLANAKGFLRRQLMHALNIRNIPDLQFREDRGIENVSRVHELLKQISREETKSDKE